MQDSTKGHARICTLNVQSTCGGNLEGTLRGCDDLHLDIALLLETKLNDEKHVRSRHGYEVNAMVTASASCGGVAWVV
jgi:hypothetical protein